MSRYKNFCKKLSSHGMMTIPEETHFCNGGRIIHQQDQSKVFGEASSDPFVRIVMPT